MSEVKTATELRKQGNHYYTFVPCENCGEYRWVRISKNGEIRGRFCLPCGCKLSGLRDSIAEQNKDIILKKYVGEKLSAASIAKELSLSVTTITSKLKSCGVTIRPNKKTDEEKEIRIKRWLENNKERKKQYSRTCNRRLKYDILNHYSEGEPKCVFCGIDDVDVLCLDHINGGGEAHRRSLPNREGLGLHLYWWIKKNNFPGGFQVLCLNCNWKKHIS